MDRFAPPPEHLRPALPPSPPPWDPRVKAAIPAGAVVALLLLLWLFPPPWIIASAADAKTAARRRGRTLVLVTRTYEEGIEFYKKVVQDPRVQAEDFRFYTDLIPDGRSSGSPGLVVSPAGASVGMVGAHGATTGGWGVTIYRPDGSVATAFTPGLRYTPDELVAWIRYANGDGPMPAPPPPPPPREPAYEEEASYGDGE